jgi:hypothetical protein
MKYEVTLYFHTYVSVVVEADNDKDAIENAYLESGNKKYDKPLLNHLTKDADPDVEIIN